MGNIINGHEYVDLGLSVVWATCNVGAQIPEEFGDYYAWGETKPKRIFNEKTCETYEKVIADISGTSRDAARMEWGAPWRMPTWEEFNKLKSSCEYEWIEKHGLFGRRLTGKSGENIYFPIAGMRDWGRLRMVGTIGYYWSSTPDEREDHTQFACGFQFDKHSLNSVAFYQYANNEDYRYYGYQIRAVADI